MRALLGVFVLLASVPTYARADAPNAASVRDAVAARLQELRDYRAKDNPSYRNLETTPAATRVLIRAVHASYADPRTAHTQATLQDRTDSLIEQAGLESAKRTWRAQGELRMKPGSRIGGRFERGKISAADMKIAAGKLLPRSR